MLSCGDDSALQASCKEPPNDRLLYQEGRIAKDCQCKCLLEFVARNSDQNIVTSMWWQCLIRYQSYIVETRMTSLRPGNFGPNFVFVKPRFVMS